MDVVESRRTQGVGSPFDGWRRLYFVSFGKEMIFILVRAFCTVVLAWARGKMTMSEKREFSSLASAKLFLWNCLSKRSATAHWKAVMRDSMG
jgi:hypothetical protein